MGFSTNIPSRLLGADAPSNKINILQIGCGRIGQVTRDYLGYMQGRPVPDWKVPNTFVKYRKVVDAWKLSC